MKKYLWLILALIGFSSSYLSLADEVAQKTDSSFVGENAPQPINSSFIGDISNSTDNDSFVGENFYFVGDSYQQQVGNSTVASFAGDGTFVGNSYGK